MNTSGDATQTPVRVVVVDDHELVRAGLRGVLGSDPAIDVVAEAADGIQALAAVEVHHPDVVVMDLQMPGMGGIEATRRILAARPGTAVLALTMFNDDDSVFAAVQAGARGYLLKGTRRDELRAGVAAVAAGHAVFGPGVAARVLERMVAPVERDEAFPELTPREREVLGHLVAGLQTPAIASRMGVADKTVRNNISSLLTKLHVVDRAAAIDQARRSGVGERRPAEVRALLFTDIDGSTALVRRLGERYPAVLADHNRIVDAAIVSHGGRRFGASGDARFAWFPAPTAAIAASVDAHRDLHRHAFPTGAEVRIRVGVHQGAVSEHAGELVGLALHETARVAGVAAGGQVVVTEECLALGSLPAVRLTDLGEQELRDLDRPMRLYRVEFSL